MMTEDIRIAFERQIIVVPTAQLLLRKKIPESQLKTIKYRRIAASIAEISIIEPLSVARLPQNDGLYLLLDGHARLACAKDLGIPDVRCLVADDDEAFTYNKRVNRLATIQEHFMILRALNSGVSEEKLAKALNVDIMHIKRRRTLLDGVCPEVIEMLKDKSVNPTTFDALRKMRPLRQIEVAELMDAAGNWTASYANALLASTRQEDLVKSDRPKQIPGLTREQMARMEREMASLNQDFKQIESSYGDDILHLVIVSGFLSKLINNPEIQRYLAQHHGELLEEFRAIVNTTSLDQTGLAA